MQFLAPLMLLGLAPLLLVRALVVAIQILRPERIDSEYLLMTTLHEEQQQEVSKMTNVVYKEVLACKCRSCSRE